MNITLVSVVYSIVCFESDLRVGCIRHIACFYVQIYLFSHLLSEKSGTILLAIKYVENYGYV